MAWVLTFDGQVYREADLTIDEAEMMEKATETSWRFIMPLRSASHAKGILSTLLVTRCGETPEAATKRVGQLKVSEFLDMLTEEDDDAHLPDEFDDGFPQPAAETSTPG